MSFKAGRHINKERIERYYNLLFDLIEKTKRRVDLNERDKNFLIETFKEQLGRIEHHELGPYCPATDIDFVESSHYDIVAIVLKCRENSPTIYEQEIALKISQALEVPLFIEYSEINEKTRTVGKMKNILWLNKGLRLINLNKHEWQEFHQFIRQKPSETQLVQFFNQRKKRVLIHKFIEGN